MRTVAFIAPLALSWAGVTALAGPLDEVLSIARRVTGADWRYVQVQPVRQYEERNGDWRRYDEPYQYRNSMRSGAAVIPGEELLQMDYRQLREVAYAANAEFDRWLASIPAGEYWVRHFQSRLLLDRLEPDLNAPLDPQEQQAVAEILKIFSQAAGESELNDILQRRSFRTLHAALRELAAPADERLTRQLSASARSLNRALDVFGTGVTWQRYLSLPDPILAAADKPAGDAPTVAELNAEELRQTFARYEQVSQNEEFEMIATLPEFQQTYQLLAEFVHPSTEASPEPRVATELLPPPEPGPR